MTLRHVHVPLRELHMTPLLVVRTRRHPDAVRRVARRGGGPALVVFDGVVAQKRGGGGVHRARVLRG